MNKLATRSLAVAALLLLAGGGYYAYRTAATADPEQRYRLQVVEKGDLSQGVSANGTLNPVVLVNVGTQVSGTVMKLHVDYNSQVKAGQALLELDDSLLAAQVRQSEANYRSAQASLDLAAANEKRVSALLDQEYVSRQDYDTALQARKSAAAGVAQAKALLDKDRVNLGNTVIRSPVSGVVVDRQVDVGQTVAASFQTPTLFKIAQDLSRMQIDSSFAEADVGNVRVGQAVRFNVDAYPNRSFRGKVRMVRLNPTTLQNVVTYDVVIDVDNPDQILLPGMTAYVNITVGSRRDVLLVPNAALRFRPAGADKEAKAGDAANGSRGEERKRKRDAASTTVYVLEGEQPKAVPVQLGITDNRNSEVVQGALKPGDRVILGEALPAAENKAGSPVRMRMF
jgi:HlyD family secretion protein